MYADQLFPTLWPRGNKRRKVTLASTLALLLSAGIAVAVWTFTIETGGSSRVATVAAPAVTAMADPPGTLLPGDAGKDEVWVTIDNSANPTQAFQITSVGKLTQAPPIVSEDEANCPASLFTYEDNDVAGLAVNVAAGTVMDWQIPNNYVKLDGAAPTTCMGVKVTLGTGGTDDQKWGITFTPVAP